MGMRGRWEVPGEAAGLMGRRWLLLPPWGLFVLDPLVSSLMWGRGSVFTLVQHCQGPWDSV